MRADTPIPLYLVVPCHLPLSATEAHYRDLLARCYVPLLTAIEAAPEMRLSLHFGGHLLDMMARHDEDVLLRIKALCQAGQVEILGGLFYGGPPALMPEHDVRGQVAMQQEFWESFIGVTPQGIYLPQNAWAPELPRLLEDTEILYSFISSAQCIAAAQTPQLLGRLERGGQRIYTLMIDHALSSQFAPDDIDTFMARLTAHHKAQLAAHRPPLHGEPSSLGTALCLPAELFGGWGLGHDRPRVGIGPLFEALGKQRMFEPELPLSFFVSPPKVVPVALAAAYAPIVPEQFNLDPVHDWSQFPGHFVEADTLYRRVLRASRTLSQSIARMEDEGREHLISDTLATAQRLLFAAQSIDSLGRGHWPGFSDPQVRDAAYSRVLRAEAAITEAMEESHLPCRIERRDLDGDRVSDVFVSTQAFNVWVLPGRGGALRTIELLGTQQNICDVGIRREDPFRVPALLAPHDAQGDACAHSHAWFLPRKGGPIGQQTDLCERRGVRDWLVPSDTAPEALMQGHVRSLADIRRPWAITRDEANPKDQPGVGYLLAQGCEAHLRTGGELHIDKTVRVHTDRPAISLHYRLAPHGDGFPAEGVLWAVEVPLRFGPHALRLQVDGQSVATHTAGGMPSPRHMSVTGGDAALHATVRGVDTLCWSPRATLVRDPDGYREVDAGVVFVLSAQVRRATEMMIELHF